MVAGGRGCSVRQVGPKEQGGEEQVEADEAVEKKQAGSIQMENIMQLSENPKNSSGKLETSDEVSHCRRFAITEELCKLKTWHLQKRPS